jgi:hypothetical protein
MNPPLLFLISVLLIFLRFTRSTRADEVCGVVGPVCAECAPNFDLKVRVIDHGKSLSRPAAGSDNAPMF